MRNLIFPSHINKKNNRSKSLKHTRPSNLETKQHENEKSKRIRERGGKVELLNKNGEMMVVGKFEIWSDMRGVSSMLDSIVV